MSRIQNKFYPGKIFRVYPKHVYRETSIYITVFAYIWDHEYSFLPAPDPDGWKHDLILYEGENGNLSACENPSLFAKKLIPASPMEKAIYE